MADADATIGWDNRDFKRGAREATRTLDRFESGFARTFKSLGSLSAVGGIVGGFASIGASLKAITQAGFDVEDIKAGLNAVSDGTESTESQLLALRKLALKPGLGFEEAAKGSINLQAVGIQADLSRRLVGGFGNALASVGKGRAELDGVTTALTQIASKGKISAEELNQIAERVPQIRTVLKDAFGTAVAQDIEALNLSATQFFEGLSKGLEGLPRASDTGRNSVENLKDAYSELLFELDETLLVTDSLTASNGILAKTLREVSSGLGIFRSGLTGSDTLGGAFGRGLGSGAASLFNGAQKERDERLKAIEDVAAAEAEASREKAKADQEQAAVLKKEVDGLSFDLSADPGQLAKLQTDLQSIFQNFGVNSVDSLRDVLAIANRTGDSEGSVQILNALKSALELKKQIESVSGRISKEEERTAEAAKRATDLKKEEAATRLAEAQTLAARREEFAITQQILKLKAEGNTEEAAALQKNLDLQREAAQIAQQLGINEEQALAIAKQTAQLKEQANNAPQLNALQRDARDKRENRGLAAKPEFKGLDALEKLQERRGNNGIIEGVAGAAAAAKNVPAGGGKDAGLTVAEKQLVAAERAATALEAITAE